jgi:ParB family transcriptional regulator, chromosome partitioning protein
MSAEKPRRLGRGLEALISTAAAPGNAGSDLQRIPVARIRPNPFQPRRDFDPQQLQELQASLSASGLLQPIAVRRRGDAYELIAGERRLRAATNLGWTEITAVIRDFDDQTLLVLALVENLQRSDLNPMEEARGYQRLIEEFRLTQQQVAEAVGKDRSTVANLLRILSLPESVRRLLETKRISAGHARAILTLADERTMVALANDIVAHGLSVREAEQRARPKKSGGQESSKVGASATPGANSGPADPTVAAAADELRRHLQTDVSIALTSPERGFLKIAFYSADDFDRLLDLILGNKRDVT